MGARFCLSDVRASASGFKLRPTPSIGENAVKKAVHKFLLLHPKVAWVARTNTGAAVYESKRTSKKRFVRFLEPGWSDFTGQLVTGEFLAVETKRPRGGVLSQDQMAFIAKVKKAGGFAIHVDNIEELDRALRAFIACRMVSYDK